MKKRIWMYTSLPKHTSGPKKKKMLNMKTLMTLNESALNTAKNPIKAIICVTSTYSFDFTVGCRAVKIGSGIPLLLISVPELDVITRKLVSFFILSFALQEKCHKKQLV